MAGSVMSPNYVPQTSRRQLGFGALRGLLDATPVGIADAVQSGINNMQSPVGAALRAVTGKAASPGDVLLGKLGLLGSGSGYDAGRFALNAAFPAMGLLGNQAGGAIPKGYARNQSGAIVWHGSPHKFDRFDASKIGTGEGAQVYGHGLYVAESPSVAKQYAENVKDISAIQRINGEMSKLAKIMQSDEIPGSYRKYRTDAGRNAANRYDELMNARSGVIVAPGQLYKVDLPDEQIAKMLDWDKPLSEQAPGVRSLIEQERKRIGGGASTGEQAYRELMFEARMQGDRSASNAMRNNAEALAASRRLQELGIPGIRYLDGGSRGAGSGSSNFVVFPGNEGLLNILERNGQPIR
jgi:hypothetical protein